jgi:hypothetical protein
MAKQTLPPRINLLNSKKKKMKIITGAIDEGELFFACVAVYHHHTV